MTPEKLAKSRKYTVVEVVVLEILALVCWALGYRPSAVFFLIVACLSLLAHFHRVQMTKERS